MELERATGPEGRSCEFFFKIQMFSLTLQIGMARPAARRLLDVIKKKRRKSMVAKLLPKAASTLSKGFTVGGGGGGTLGRKKNADQPSNVSIPPFLDILKKTQNSIKFS